MVSRLACSRYPASARWWHLASIDVNDNAQFAVLRSGGVAGWGTNRASQASCGQLDSSTPVVTAPRAINGLASIVAAAGGSGHALFVDQKGVVFGCGGNASGQLGDGSMVGTGGAKPGPLRVNLAAEALAIGAGRSASAAVDVEGGVWVWGQLANGAAGNGAAITANGLQLPTPQTVVSESGGGRFDAGALATAPALYTGTQTGALNRVTIDVGFSPLPADLGLEARIYLAAMLSNGDIFLYSDATGWRLFDGTTVTPYRRGALSRHVALPLYREADLSGTAGIRLVVGYGRGSTDEAAQADLLNRATFGEALTLR